MGIIGVDSHARDMYGNSHSQGTGVLFEIPSMLKLVQYYIHVGIRICMRLKVYILPTLI